MVSSSIAPLQTEALTRWIVDDLASQSVDLGQGITGIRWARSDHSSSYECYVITISFADREQRLFLKDFTESRISKEEPASRRERELRVYREILSRWQLGTATYYGSNGHWLLLEYVTGLPLKYFSAPSWLEACRWLGRKQAYVAARPSLLGAATFLPTFDEGYFRSMMEPARQNLLAVEPDVAHRATAVLVMYENLVPAMASQPVTLQHGTYRPQQILFDPASEPPRICPVDWEKAAIAPELLDLAFIADGFEDSMVSQMIDVYLAEASSAYRGPHDRGDLIRLINCYRLYRVVNWMGQIVQRRFTGRQVQKLVAHGERVHRALAGPTRV